MRHINTKELEPNLADYYENFFARFHFYHGAVEELGDHEEALLRCEYTDYLPSSGAPERISAHSFYGRYYFSDKNTFVYYVDRDATCPVYASTNEALTEKECERFGIGFHDTKYDRRFRDPPDRLGFCWAFSQWRGFHRYWDGRDIHRFFKSVEGFMTNDIQDCVIYDWRADLGAHCTEEYDVCFGNYLWTVYCPDKKRLTVIWSHPLYTDEYNLR